MTEPTPPPERPLDDRARARIRADLLVHADEHRSASPRWVVPAGAAAAVALVAGLGYWAISPGGSETDGLPVTGEGTSTAPATPEPSAPSAPNEGTATPTPAGPDDSVQVGTRTCEEEMAFVLKDAELAFRVDDASSFYVKGDRFVQCDELGERTTIHRPLPLTPRDDVSTYAVSSLFDGKQMIRAAGGVVLPGAEEVFDVAYTFPDGHTEHADKSTDNQGRTWWRMVYAYDDGGGNEMEKPEIEVTMSLSGVQKHYTLAWGEDTCAQANHGC
jgi:hypothetical protein